MKDGSMFRKLEEYKDKDFWKENPYFYIYTPDGKEITYKIYSVGQVLDTSDTYLTSFAGEEDYQKFLDMTMKEADYDTGVKVTTDDTIVTVSYTHLDVYKRQTSWDRVFRDSGSD